MQGSVLGRRYEYTLTRPESDFKVWAVERIADRMYAMVDWCNEQKMTGWGYQGFTFWFTYEKDYVMFMLRWG